MRSQHPGWLSNDLTAEAVRDAITTTCESLAASDPVYGLQLGAGRLNALGAVQLGPLMPRLGDFNNDGAINGSDLSLLLSAWGLTHSPANLDGNGRVGGSDLAYLFSAWG